MSMLILYFVRRVMLLNFI